MFAAQKFKELEGFDSRGMKVCSCTPVFCVQGVIGLELFASFEHVFEGKDVVVKSRERGGGTNDGVRIQVVQ